MAGCLFRQTGEAPRPPAPAPAPGALEAVKAAVAAPPDPRSPCSPYGERPAPAAVERMSGSLEPTPDDRFRVKITPAPPPAEPPPEKAAPVTPAAAPSPAAPPPPASEPPLLAAMNCVLENQPARAQALLAQSGQANPELLLDLLDLAVRLWGKQAELSPEEMEHALQRLRAQTLSMCQLTLGKVCYCRRIKNYGQYTPLPEGHAFQAGCEGQPGECVQVYAEVRNFATHTRDNQYETVLASSLEFQPVPVDLHRDADRRGRASVVTMNLKPSVERSQSARQDYFLNIEFRVPPGMPPGLYTLRLTVRDKTPAPAGRACRARVASRLLDFRVCPPGARPHPAP
jgi:hypothetical protein